MTYTLNVNFTYNSLQKGNGLYFRMDPFNVYETIHVYKRVLNCPLSGLIRYVDIINGASFNLHL